MRRQLEVFYADEDGATAIEYSFMAALVAIAGFASLSTMGNVLETMYDFVANEVSDSMGNG